jgi:hypothetical protein
MQEEGAAAQNLVFESVQRKYAALRNREVGPGPDQTRRNMRLHLLARARLS